MRRVFKTLFGTLGAFLHSIRFRLTLWFILILAFVLGVFSVFIYFAQARDLQFDAARSMQEKFAHVQDYLHSPAFHGSSLSSTGNLGNEAPLQSGDMMLLVDTSGQVVQGWGANPNHPDDLVGALVTAASNSRELSVYQRTVQITQDGGNTFANTDYLFVITPVVRDDLLLGFLIIGSPSQLPSQLGQLRLSLLLGSLGMLVIAFLGGLWLADRAMRPVKTITHTARNISESDLSQRLNLRGRDELAELAGTFDAMLARLQTAFDRQRRFVADASHELRTPLTIMNLEVGRVLSGERPMAEYQHALKVVEAEGGRMSRLVNDLMTLARMDSGQTLLQFDNIDLSDAIVDAVERLSPLADQQQVTFDIDDLPELPVRGDHQYLVQMVSNLLENAVKYGRAGGKVRIQAGSRDESAGDVAWVRVTDSGPGIPPEHLPHLFDRFYRVDQARARDADEDSNSPTGSGLGLSIVSWIAQTHGGSVRVDSKLDEGTTFEVVLPLNNPILDK